MTAVMAVSFLNVTVPFLQGMRLEIRTDQEKNMALEAVTNLKGYRRWPRYRKAVSAKKACLN
jgi:hypothetical protein